MFLINLHNEEYIINIKNINNKIKSILLMLILYNNQILEN